MFKNTISIVYIYIGRWYVTVYNLCRCKKNIVAMFIFLSQGV